MLNLLPFLAQVNDSAEAIKAAANAARQQPFFRTDTLVVIGAIVLVSTGLFVWVFFLRRRPDEMHGSVVLYRNKDSRRGASGERYGASGRRRKRKRRVEHPDNLPRNPTLAETGGLPPPKPEEPAAPEDDAGGPQPVQPQSR